MSSEHLLVLAKLSVASQEHRDQCIELLNKIVPVSEADPDTHKYAIFLPRENDDGKAFYVIEEYTDKSAFDVHMADPSVGEISALLAKPGTIDPDIPPSLSFFTYLPGQHFIRPEINSHSDPHFLIANLTYIDGGIEKATPYWKGVVDEGREKEQGTLQYGVARSIERENELLVFEGYESEAYLKDVHVPSASIQKSIANTKDLRTGLVHTKLKKIGGFLTKQKV